MSSYFYKAFLSVYETRKSKNSLYSLRAFSRDCKMPVSRLSQYFSGKRIIKEKAASEILEKFKDKKDEHELLLQGFESSYRQKENAIDFYSEVESRFDKLSYYVFLAHLNLEESFNFEKNWFVDSNISKEEVQSIVKDLEELNVIEKKEDSWVFKTNNMRLENVFFKIKNKKIHKDILTQHQQMVDDSLEQLNDIQSYVIATDAHKIKEAQIKISQFIKKLMQYLQSGQKNQIYTLSIQLEPWMQIKKRDN